MRPQLEGTMKQMKLLVLAVACLFSLTALAQQRGALSPAEQAARFAQRQAQLAVEVRPIDAIDSIWIEELTVLETRDAIRGGKTTGIIATGGVESNGPHLASGKHNFVLKQTAEAVARKLGNALVAPIVTLEPYRTDQPVGIGNWVGLSQATYKSVLYDMGDSMRA